MQHYVLTDEDYAKVVKQNSRNDWGFSQSMLKYQLSKHRKAWRTVNDASATDDEKYQAERQIAMVEERLTDANFHTFASLLYEHKYADASDWIKKEG